MEPFKCDPSGWIEKNRNQYGERYGLLNWVSKTTSQVAEDQRQKLLNQLDPRIHYGFKDTKIDCRNLSRGCTLCGKGLWSCLFINGLCNCKCFYCPTVQDEESVPTTNTVSFQDPLHYVDYLKELGFKGVSISGGEPLLTFEKSLRYLSAVKKHAGEDIYCWLYTNGTLVTEDILKQLRDIGLNEIRFDIGAVNYNLSFAEKAVKYIPTVTVEIPAVPEDKEILMAKLVSMSESGIKHLNLHQLRLTPHNFFHLSQRPYTFLHGEQVTVMESEITALEIISETIKQKLLLNVNYCAFHYKNSFQQSAARKRAATYIKKPHEEITEKGYLRTITIKDSSLHVQKQIQILSEKYYSAEISGMTIKNETQIHITLDNLITLFKTEALKDADIFVSYAHGVICDHLTYHHPFIELRLPTKLLYVERRTASDMIKISTEELMEGIFSEKIIPFETILPGWKPYC